MSDYKDITIKTSNPAEADRLLQNFGILLMNPYEKDEKGNYKARCIGDLSYAKFAIKNQGYNFVEIIEC